MGIAVWAKGHRREPISTYAQTMRELGIPAPYLDAFDDSKVTLDDEEVKEILAGAGFSSVEARIQDLTSSWPNRDAVVSAIFGTPYGPLVANFPSDQRKQLLDNLAAKFEAGDDGSVRLVTSAVLAKATA